MSIRASIAAAITLCFAFEALPASAQSVDFGASVNITLPTAFIVVGNRQYYKRSPGWGYRRNKHGWYKLPTHSDGYITIGGRQYYERSPGPGYRKHRNGWYKTAPVRARGGKKWKGRGKFRRELRGNNGNGRGNNGNGRGNNGNGRGRGHDDDERGNNGKGRGHGKGHRD